ncbi:MAG: glutamate synthase subunit beta [Lentisphaerae bacterium]|nr:glutamate synthase subunit beta [Lentisphaerota bacterium]
MGKPGGFLEFRRQDPGYRPVQERLQDYGAVELPPPMPLAREQAQRCMDCGIPFCHGHGCPLCNIIPEVNDLASRGRWRQALDLLLATNNFPEFTGRICPALCEAACVLGINDEPVTIRQIELAVIEHAFDKGWMRPRTPPRRLPFRMAVIGSGPAGLAVADTLNQAGCRVTVYDGDLRPGGILRYGIPDFKLEKWIIDRRIDLMREEGVEFEMQAAIGEDLSARFLQTRFQAICLAGGARQPRNIAVPGRGLDGIHFALDFLIQQNLRFAGDPIPEGPELHASGKNVIVIGGGDTGSDCLGTALRQGAASVTQLEIMPEPPAQRDPTTPWPLWPHMLRESSSHKEGGRRLWSVQTVGFSGKQGRLQMLHCVRTSGRPPELQTVPGSEFDLPADMVLLAMGFTGPIRNKLAEELHLAHDTRGNLLTDADCMTNAPGVFAAGDAALGASLVVRAIDNGRRCAAGILRRLESEKA